jgi:hypothetical protein
MTIVTIIAVITENKISIPGKSLDKFTASHGSLLTRAWVDSLSV